MFFLKNMFNCKSNYHHFIKNDEVIVEVTL